MEEFRLCVANWCANSQRVTEVKLAASSADFMIGRVRVVRMFSSCPSACKLLESMDLAVLVRHLLQTKTHRRDRTGSAGRQWYLGERRTYLASGRIGDGSRVPFRKPTKGEVWTLRDIDVTKHAYTIPADASYLDAYRIAAKAKYLGKFGLAIADHHNHPMHQFTGLNYEGVDFYLFTVNYLSATHKDKNDFLSIKLLGRFAPKRLAAMLKFMGDPWFQEQFPHAVAWCKVIVDHLKDRRKQRLDITVPTVCVWKLVNAEDAPTPGPEPQDALAAQSLAQQHRHVVEAIATTPAPTAHQAAALNSVSTLPDGLGRGTECSLVGVAHLFTSYGTASSTLELHVIKSARLGAIFVEDPCKFTAKNAYMGNTNVTHTPRSKAPGARRNRLKHLLVAIHLNVFDCIDLLSSTSRRANRGEPGWTLARVIVYNVSFVKFRTVEDVPQEFKIYASKEEVDARCMPLNAMDAPFRANQLIVAPRVRGEDCGPDWVGQDWLSPKEVETREENRLSKNRLRDNRSLADRWWPHYQQLIDRGFDHDFAHIIANTNLRPSRYAEQALLRQGFNVHDESVAPPGHQVLQMREDDMTWRIRDAKRVYCIVFDEEELVREAASHYGEHEFISTFMVFAASRYMVRIQDDMVKVFNANDYYHATSAPLLVRVKDGKIVHIRLLKMTDRQKMFAWGNAASGAGAGGTAGAAAAGGGAAQVLATVPDGTGTIQLGAGDVVVSGVPGVAVHGAALVPGVPIAASGGGGGGRGRGRGRGGAVAAGGGGAAASGGGGGGRGRRRGGAAHLPGGAATTASRSRRRLAVATAAATAATSRHLAPPQQHVATSRARSNGARARPSWSNGVSRMGSRSNDSLSRSGQRRS